MWNGGMMETESIEIEAIFLPSSIPPFTLRLQSIRFICFLLYILSLRNWRVGVKRFAFACAALLSWNVSRQGCRIFM